MQQRIEELREEMNNLFTVQKLYLRNMNTHVKRIAARPVVHSYPVQRQMSGHTTTSLSGSLNFGGNNNGGRDDEGGGNDSKNEAWYKDWE